MIHKFQLLGITGGDYQMKTVIYYRECICDGYYTEIKCSEICCRSGTRYLKSRVLLMPKEVLPIFFYIPSANEKCLKIKSLQLV